MSVIIRSLSSSSVCQGQDGLSGGVVSDSGESSFECLRIMLPLYSLFCTVSVILSLSLVTYPTYCFLHFEVDNLQVSEFLIVYWWPVDVLLLLVL